MSVATNVLASRRTIVDVTFRGRSLLYQVTLILAGALLAALMAQVRIPLPFTPVPITGQTYAALLVGGALGSHRGSASLLLYLLLGGVGLPFYAGGEAGWAVLLGSTGGYLVGFVLAAFVVGWLAECGWDRRFGTAILAMLAGEVAIYLAGVPWLAAFLGVSKAIPLGLLPFIPGDAIKLCLAAATLPVAWKLIDRK